MVVQQTFFARRIYETGIQALTEFGYPFIPKRDAAFPDQNDRLYIQVLKA